jgi:glycine/D-amino acid oxidase-like deaminating enzyme
MRTHPYFFDAFPSSRRPSYPTLRGPASARVAIVGGGLTGAACAAAFAAAGVQTILLEADRIGAGATGGSPGLLRQDLDASFMETVGRHGLRDARHVWEAARRASLDFGAALRRLRIRCGIDTQGLSEVTRGGSQQVKQLRREYEARRAAGLDVTWQPPKMLHRDLRITADGGLRIRGAVLDPYRAAIGLADAAARRGATVFERSAVLRVRATRKSVQIRTERGVVTAEAVLIATGGALSDLRALRRHLPLQRSFFVVTDPLPAAVRKEVGSRSAAIEEVDAPKRLLRWLDDDRVLFAQACETAGRRPTSSVVVANAMELMYRLTTLYPPISGVQPAWAWDTEAYGSPDDLPLIGRHRNFPRHLFALGTGRSGAGIAWLAARVLLRNYLDEPAKRDEVFGFARVL